MEIKQIDMQDAVEMVAAGSTVFRAFQIADDLTAKDMKGIKAFIKVEDDSDVEKLFIVEKKARKRKKRRLKNKIRRIAMKTITIIAGIVFGLCCLSDPTPAQLKWFAPVMIITLCWLVLFALANIESMRVKR